MDHMSVAQAVLKHRLPIFCATCKKYYEGRAKGLPDPECTSKRCGGPFARKDFPDYEGPIPKENFHKWCFVCGGPSDMGVRVRGSERVFGVCHNHAPMLRDLAPAGEENKTHDPIDLLTKNGTTTPEKKYRRQKTLREAIAEADEYYDEQDRKKRLK